MFTNEKKLVYRLVRLCRLIQIEFLSNVSGREGKIMFPSKQRDLAFVLAVGEILSALQKHGW